MVSMEKEKQEKVVKGEKENEHHLENEFNHGNDDGIQEISSLTTLVNNNIAENYEEMRSNEEEDEQKEKKSCHQKKKYVSPFQQPFQEIDKIMQELSTLSSSNDDKNDRKFCTHNGDDITSSVVRSNSSSTSVNNNIIIGQSQVTSKESESVIKEFTLMMNKNINNR